MQVLLWLQTTLTVGSEKMIELTANMREKSGMKKERLALFDLDGTLFDTGDVNYHSYKDALQPYNIQLDKHYFFTKCNGRHYTEFLPIIMGTNEFLESVHKTKKETYAQNLDKARANVHLLAMIQAIRGTYHTAVVTTASRKNTTDILRYFCCEDLFDLIITHEDVTHVKPNPEGFLKAMNHFGMDAEHTIIFEDSDVGIQAAKTIGASLMVVEQF